MNAAGVTGVNAKGAYFLSAASDGGVANLLINKLMIQIAAIATIS